MYIYISGICIAHFSQMIQHCSKCCYKCVSLEANMLQFLLPPFAETDIGGCDNSPLNIAYDRWCTHANIAQEISNIYVDIVHIYIYIYIG